MTALKTAEAATERRPSAPILSAVRMRVNGVDEGSIAFEANDLDVQITSRIPAPEGGTKVGGDWLIAQPMALRSVLGRCNSKMIVIEADGKDKGRLNVTAGDQSVSVTGLDMNPDDFPAMVPGDLGKRMMVGASFAAALQRLLPAVSTEETRYYLNGIAIRHLGDWAFRLAATDGHRLHIAQVEIPDAVGPFWDGDAIISRHTLARLMPLLQGAKEGGGIAFWSPPPRNSVEGTAPEPDAKPGMPSRVQFATDDALMTAKLIDGTFLDVMRVVPGAAAAWLEVDRAALIRAVQTAGDAMPGQKERCVKLVLGEDGRCAVSSTAELRDGISATTVIDAQSFAIGPGIHAAFRSSYLIDALNAFGGGRVRLSWPDGAIHSHPCRIDDPADDKFLVVVMSMRI
ncbi:MAG: hypothetical protein IE932_14265 [Sphingopyxis terrae]|nr:hypothetical protein [Sphingopyxis terrae]